MVNTGRWWVLGDHYYRLTARLSISRTGVYHLLHSPLPTSQSAQSAPLLEFLISRRGTTIQSPNTEPRLSPEVPLSSLPLPQHTQSPESPACLYPKHLHSLPTPCHGLPLGRCHPMHGLLKAPLYLTRLLDWPPPALPNTPPERASYKVSRSCPLEVFPTFLSVPRAQTKFLCRVHQSPSLATQSKVAPRCSA